VSEICRSRGCHVVRAAGFTSLLTPSHTSHDATRVGGLGLLGGSSSGWGGRLRGDLFQPTLYVLFNTGDLVGRLAAGTRVTHQTPSTLWPNARRSRACSYTPGSLHLLVRLQRRPSLCSLIELCNDRFRQERRRGVRRRHRHSWCSGAPRPACCSCPPSCCVIWCCQTARGCGVRRYLACTGSPLTASRRRWLPH
jgi:hypothetical protein